MEELVTAVSAASILSVTRNSIYRLVERRRIPFYRLPSGLRFRRRDLEAYLSERRVEPEPKPYGGS